MNTKIKLLVKILKHKIDNIINMAEEQQQHPIIIRAKKNITSEGTRAPIMIKFGIIQSYQRTDYSQGEKERKSQNETIQNNNGELCK